MARYFVVPFILGLIISVLFWNAAFAADGYNLTWDIPPSSDIVQTHLYCSNTHPVTPADLVFESNVAAMQIRVNSTEAKDWGLNDGVIFCIVTFTRTTDGEGCREGGINLTKVGNLITDLDIKTPGNLMMAKIEKGQQC